MLSFRPRGHIILAPLDFGILLRHRVVHFVRQISRGLKVGNECNVSDMGTQSAHSCGQMRWRN